MFSRSHFTVRKLLHTFMLLALVVTSFGVGGTRVHAQQGQVGGTPPPHTPIRTRPGLGGPAGALQDDQGRWYMPAGAKALPDQPAGGVSAQSTGGPDDFGYTWDDSVDESWVSAAAGTDTGLDADVDQAGPFNLGFSFEYYEKSYTQVRVSRFGYLSFDEIIENKNRSEIPMGTTPNNVITPFWFYTTGVNGYVKYLSGGSGTDHWFAMEWNRLESIGNEYTFEVILYENGDIVFQYGNITINGASYCGSAGIEDTLGVDGLAVIALCSDIHPNHDIRFTRPSPSARVNFVAKAQGKLTSPGSTEEFTIVIRNTGDTGSDVFDLTPSSAWTLSIHREDGVTSLTDTDSDGIIDTGTLAQGDTFTVIARVTVPAGAIAGNSNTATLTASSSLDTAVSRAATLQTAVPMPFVQAYRNQIDGPISLYLAQPGGQATTKLPPDGIFQHDPTIAETSNGMIYLWDQDRCLSDDCNSYVGEIYYGMTDRYGKVTHGPTRLSDLSDPDGPQAFDSSPVAAITPNGNIGLAWVRLKFNEDFYFNYNIWFAVLSPTGELVQAQTNLTNNSMWEAEFVYSPIFAHPRIAATTDNRFVMAWTRYMVEGGEVDDIYYAIRSDTGAAVVPVTRLTADTTGNDSNFEPVLTSLGSGRVFISWQNLTDEWNGEIHYAVIRSNGTLAKVDTTLSKADGILDWQNWDAVQLTSGRILAVWEGWGCGEGWNSRLVYAVLDGSYNRIGDPTCLGTAPGAITGEHIASVAASINGKGVITWTDNRNLYLYYAMINGTGAILTPPTIFLTQPVEDPQLDINGYGFGNTSYSLVVTGPDLHVESDASISASSNLVTVPIRYSNRGDPTNGPVTLAATLNNGLTYDSDSEAAAPVISGNKVTWTLLGLDFLDEGTIDLRVNVPESPSGTRFPIQLTISFAGVESNPMDNEFDLEVYTPYRLFQPVTSMLYKPDVTYLRWFVGFGTSSEPYQLGIEQEVVDDFNASQNRIEIKLEAVPYADALDTLKADIEKGSPPDIVGPISWIDAEQLHGEWLDLAPYIESTGFDTSIFTPALLDWYETADEGTVALPFEAFPSTLYYIPAMFDEQGLVYPPAHYGDLYEMPDHSLVPWSWETLSQVGKWLTIDARGRNATEAGFDRDNIVQYGFSWGFERHPNYWGSYWQGGTLLHGAPGSYTAAVPEAWKASWQWVYDGIWGTQPFIPSRLVAESPEFGYGNDFDTGKIAMLENPSWYLCCLGDLAQAGIEFQMGAMPDYNGVVGGRVDGDTFRIPKTSQHPAEAFTALTYLVTTGVQKLIIGNPDQLPAYNSLSAIPTLNQPWLDRMKANIPTVTDASWDVLLQGMNYPDIPSAEGFVPNLNAVWNRLDEFGNLLTKNAGVNLTQEIYYLEVDLTEIFNQ